VAFGHLANGNERETLMTPGQLKNTVHDLYTCDECGEDEKDHVREGKYLLCADRIHEFFSIFESRKELEAERKGEAVK